MRAGGRLARGPPVDRNSTTRHLPDADNRARPLPDLPPDRRSGIDAAMDVLFRNAVKQIIEAVFGRSRGFDDDFSVLHGEIDLRAVFQLDIAGDGFGDSQGQAVAPFLDCGVHGGLPD